MQTPVATINRHQRAISSALVLFLAVGLLLPASWRLLRGLPNPTLTSSSEPSLDYMMSIEYGWIMQSQTADGAIAQTYRGDSVIPYFANLSALALVRENPRAVRDYMEWYLSHVNKPDSSGLFGTIYNYAGVPITSPPDVRVASAEAQTRIIIAPKYGPAAKSDFQPTGEYDSADSYASTFLSLVEDYTASTNDLTFARRHVANIKLVADVILALQDDDGLVWAKADHPKKYLMDNSENYRGLEDFSALLSRLDLADLARGYGVAAQRVKDGILDRLWDAKTKTFYWYLDQNGRRARVNWRTWYPDAVSQVFPILDGLISPSDPRAQGLWAALNKYHEDWVSRMDVTPWAIVAYVATVMGDSQRADAAIDTLRAAVVKAQRDPQWHSAESAFIYLAYEARRGRLPKHYLVN
ncbi:MAG TPA: hypothetical protein VGL40_08880 [Bacillota bacterium]|jgi:hypothetical protein